MKQRIYNGHPLEFFNSSNDKKAEIKISGSDLILNPLDSSGTVIIGEAGTINDIEVGAVGTAVDFTFLGGGTLTSNGGTLTIGAEGDTIDLSNTTIAAISASVFTGSFVGDGTNLVNVVPDLSSYSGNVGVTGNLTVTGKVTAEEFHTEFVSASIIYMSGSTKFGDTSDDVHDFTGSINIKDGDLLVNTNGGGYIQIDESDDSLKLADINKLKIGTGNDLQIYHDSSTNNSHINEVGTGDLIIQGGNDIVFKDANGLILANMNQSNSVELNFGGNKKFETLNTGVSVTGNISGSNDLRLEGDATQRKITFFSGGSIAASSAVLHTNNILYLRGGSNGLFLQNSDGSDGYYISNTDHKWEVGASEIMRLNSTGLGIGTNSPGTKLDVNGLIRTVTPVQYTSQVSANTVFSPGTDGQIATAQPFSNRWHDLFAFQRNFSVTQSISTNGTDFSDQTLDSAIFTRQSRVSTEVISSGERAVRFTFTGTAYCVGKYVAVFFGFSSPSPTVTITVESSANGTSWTSLSSGSVTASSNSHYVYLHTAAGDGGNNYLRVTFDKGNTDTKVVDICSLQLLTARHGDQGKGMEDEFPFTYDVNKKITLEGGAITGDNAKVISSRKFTARDGNGVMLTADDAASGLSIADNGDGTFKGNGNNYFLRLDTDNNAIGDTAKIQFNDRAVVGWTGSAVYLGDGGQNKDIKLQVGTGNINLLTSNQTRLSVLTAGGIQFHSYGSGNNTGTAAYNLQVDSSGNIIESALGGGGTIDGSGAANRIAIWSDADTLTSDADFTVDGDTIFTKNLEASNNILVSKDFQLGTIANNNGEFALGQTIANKVFSYGAEFQATNASIQIVLGRNNGSSVLGTGAIGADQNNAFAVWETSGPSTLMEISQSGVTTFNSKVGINTDPHSSISGLHVNGDVRVDSSDGVATRKIRSGYFSSTTDITVQSGASGSVILQNGNNTVLTLSGSNQAAKFEGDVIINRSSVLGTAKLSIQADAGEDVIGVQCNSNNTTTKLLNVFNSSGVDIVSLTVNNDSTPDLLFNTDDGSGTITEALKLDSSQNATFANGVSIGDSGAVYGTDNASAGIFLRAANRGVSGEFSSGYARNLIRSNGSETIQIGDNTSLISLINLKAGSSAVDGVVSFSTKNSERMRVHHDGSVGIGTNNPGSILHILKDQSAASSVLKLENKAGANNSGFDIDFQLATSGVSAKIGAIRTNSPGAGDSDIFFSTSTNGTSVTEAMRIKHDGKVGIGTNAPASILHINTGTGTQNSNTVILDRSGSNDYSGLSFATAGTVDWSIGQNSAGNFEIFEDGTDVQTRVTVKTGGNVGINNANPTTGRLVIREDTGYGIRTENASGYTFRVSGSGLAQFGGTVEIPEYIVHSGDTDTKIGFNTSNNIELRAGGNLQISADASRAYLRYQGTSKLRTDSTGVLVDGAAKFTTNVSFDSGEAGRIYKASNHGLAIHGVVGTENNFAIFTPTGQLKIVNPSGSNDLVLNRDSGNVGIGTASPGQKLEVAGAIHATGSTLIASNDAANSVGLSLRSPASGVNVNFDFEVGDTGISNLHAKNLVLRGSSGASDIAFSPSTAYPGLMMLDGSAGRVGIGTTVPGGTLHVVGQSGGAGEIYISDIDDGGGTSDGFLLTKSGTSAFVYNRDNGMLRFGSNDRSTDLTIGNSGNIGIGTTNTSKINSTTTFFRPDPNGKLLVMNHNSGSFINLETNATGGGDQVGGIYFSKTGNQSDAHFHVAGIDAVLLDHATDALDGGELRFFTKGTGAGDTSHHMILDHTGKLGIGQNIDPSYTLHVNASSTNEIARFASTDDDGIISIQDGNDTVYVGYDHSNTAMSLGFSNSFSSDNNITIKSDGKVGIGTDNPDDGDSTLGAPQLHVKGPGGTGRKLVARFQSASDENDSYASIILNHANDRGLIFSGGRASSNRAIGFINLLNHVGGEITDGITLHQVASGGAVTHVGIGTTSPGRKLTVSADIGVGNGNKIFLWNDHDDNYLKYNEWKMSASAGTDIKNIAATGNINIGAGNTDDLLVVSASGNVHVANDLVVAGKITAEEFHTEFVSASIIYQSGSTKFGDTSDDNHDFTGSVNISGNVELRTGNHLFFDGGGNGTYISEDIADRLRFFVGGTEFARFTESTTDTINFYPTTNFSGNVSVNGQLNVGDSNADILQVGLKSVVSYGENTDVDTGTETVKELAIATYQAAFFDFVIKNGTNVRAGTITAAHDGTNVEFNEVSTVDLGNTNDVKLSVDISGGNMRLRATTLSDNWSVKAFVRAIKV